MEHTHGSLHIGQTIEERIVTEQQGEKKQKKVIPKPFSILNIFEATNHFYIKTDDL
jgi:hypothetical protein